MAPVWRHARGVVGLDRPIVMGIVNVTPDSFSDGGQFASPRAAADHARRLVSEGADLLDVGGESTRPQGATPVTVEEELRRVMPVIELLARELPEIPMSIDTTKSAIAAAALDAGAAIVNDVSGFRLDPELACVCARAGAGVVLMHSRGTVSDMASYRHATYTSVTSDVIAELSARVDAARAAGVDADAVVVDPGIGFSKRSEHSLQLLHDLGRIVAMGFPVLVGASRKRFIGELTGEPEPAARVVGTVAVNVTALERGARVFRVHDVKPNRQALDAAWAVLHVPLPESAA